MTIKLYTTTARNLLERDFEWVTQTVHTAQESELKLTLQGMYDYLTYFIQTNISNGHH